MRRMSEKFDVIKKRVKDNVERNREKYRVAILQIDMEDVGALLDRITQFEELRAASIELVDNMQNDLPVGADEEDYMIVEFELNKKVAERFTVALSELEQDNE